MNPKPAQFPVEWAVLAFCIWQAMDLVTAWRHSPLDAAEPLALALWLRPAWQALFGKLAPGSNRPRPAGPGRAGLAWIALAAVLAGTLADMHFLKHCALALACAAVLPPVQWSGLWLALSLCWMPALGWLLGALGPRGMAVARISLALVVALMAANRQRPEFPPPSHENQIPS